MVWLEERAKLVTHTVKISRYDSDRMKQLVEKGQFSSYSEILRAGLRDYLDLRFRGMKDSIPEPKKGVV